jgi:alpha-ketoglutarate-dependent taurine dioxygenase
MKPVMPDSVRALAVFSGKHLSDYVQTIEWSEGKVVVIDNWRLLHGRGSADGDDADRVILRISIR